jgi:hypothetical protein
MAGTFDQQPTFRDLAEIASFGWERRLDFAKTRLEGGHLLA